MCVCGFQGAVWVTELKQFNMAPWRFFDDSVEIIDFNIVGLALGSTGWNPDGPSALGDALAVHYTNTRARQTLCLHKLTSSSSATPMPASRKRTRVHEQVDCMCIDGAGMVEHPLTGCGGLAWFGVIASLDPPSMHTAAPMSVAEDN